MNRSESKYFNTALLMDEALLSLLEKKDFEFITIKEICEKAGVNRSTFYLHYETPNDLLAECLEYVNKQFLSSFPQKPDSFISGIDRVPLSELVLVNSEMLTPYLSFIKQHIAVFKAIYKNPASMQANEQFSNISEYVLRPIMKRFGVPESERNYWITFFIHGCMAIINEWLSGGCKESIDEIAAIILHCVRPENGLQGDSYKE